MTDHPMLFSAPMVRALLDGRKTQTRRPLKTVALDVRGGRPMFPVYGDGKRIGSTNAPATYSTLYKPGDRIWVRERVHVTNADLAVYFADYPDNAKARGMENIPPVDRVRWTPSIHMPRWASRLTLTITEVRVQRVMEISEEDAIAEGVTPIVDHGVGNQHRHRIAFEQLWESLNADRAPWLSNPWVCAISFSVEQRNIDAEDTAQATSSDGAAA